MAAADSLRTPPRAASRNEDNNNMIISTAPPVNHMNNSSALSSAASPHLTAASAMVHALFADHNNSSNSSSNNNNTLGPCWGDFDCSHQRIPGRLYAVTSGILFYSNLLGFERRLCLQYDDIQSLTLYRTTSLRIELMNSSNGGPAEVYIFRSFRNREQVLQLLMGLKRLADEERMGVTHKQQQNNNTNSNKPRATPARTQSEGISSHEQRHPAYSWSSSVMEEEENEEEEHHTNHTKNNNGNSPDSFHSTTPRQLHASLSMDYSIQSSPSSPGLFRSAVSDAHLQEQQQQDSSNNVLFNRRRAVSDTLVRLLGREERVVLPGAPTRDELRALEPNATDSDKRDDDDEPGDSLQKAWELATALQQDGGANNQLDEIGIEVCVCVCVCVCCCCNVNYHATLLFGMLDSLATHPVLDLLYSNSHCDSIVRSTLFIANFWQTTHPFPLIAFSNNTLWTRTLS